MKVVITKSYLKMLGKTCIGSALFLGICFNVSLSAQEVVGDSLKMVPLQEVILISSSKTLDHRRQSKPLATLDEYLESSSRVNMVKRGAYAWEPTMNNMSSERLSVTIDGMQVFGACTDKMDPVTSYVDVSNLAEAQISSGQQGAAFGNMVGGGINLKLDKGGFRPSGWTGGIESSFESNNSNRVFGGELNYSDVKFYIDTDVIYRKADNYKAGGGEKVEFSQFEKYNFSVNSGVKLSEEQAVSGSLIYDEARDVGYPALPMDVSLARAIIASLAFNQDTLFGKFSDWESKVYYNTIKHVMDDTKRPDVAIHMDMPGWSETVGAYSQVNWKLPGNDMFLKLDGYFNKSLAEMTMYPVDTNEALMFMLTWPDIHTTNMGVYAQDNLEWDKSSLKLSTRLTYHSNTVADEFGLNSLKIFYPEMEKTNTRFLKSFSAQYHRMLNPFHLTFGLSYGERAPSVSEGYGFYLFNSFDAHDYIGDPGLKTEASSEANIALTFKKPLFEITAEANYFYIDNYIIGKVDNSLSTMTIGADGVKIYMNLNSAQIFNTSFSARYMISNAFTWAGRVSYSRGVDDNKGNLPLISPVSYRSSLDFFKNNYSASVVLNGAAEQSKFNADYGEVKTSAYATVSASVGKRFFINENSLFVKGGVENLFDNNYSTYNDWKNIPQMGRNFFLTLSYSFK